MAVVLIACAGTPTLPRPRMAPQPSDAFHVVPYPAPAALVEVVPDPPRPDAVWIDGSWVWRVRHFAWERGGWVIPPDRATYSPPDARYRADGTLTYAPATWRSSSGRSIRAPKLIASANPSPRGGMAEEGTPP